MVRPELPAGFTDLPNPIDAFVAAESKAKGLTPAYVKQLNADANNPNAQDPRRHRLQRPHRTPG